MNLEDKAPFATPYEWIGGQDRVRALVDRFYDLMDLEPGYRELRSAHGSELTAARDKLYWFLSAGLSDPQNLQRAFWQKSGSTP